MPFASNENHQHASLRARIELFLISALSDLLTDACAVFVYMTTYAKLLSHYRKMGSEKEQNPWFY